MRVSFAMSLSQSAIPVLWVGPRTATSCRIPERATRNNTDDRYVTQPRVPTRDAVIRVVSTQGSRVLRVTC